MKIQSPFAGTFLEYLSYLNPASQANIGTYRVSKASPGKICGGDIEDHGRAGV